MTRHPVAEELLQRARQRSRAEVGSNALERIDVRRRAASRWDLTLIFALPPPSNIAPEQIHLLDVRGIRALDLKVEGVVYPDRPGARTLLVPLRDERPKTVLLSDSDLPPYTLRLSGVPAEQLDPARAEAGFLLATEGTEAEDAAPPSPPLPEPEPRLPAINYLARDYAALREEMLNQLELLMPAWSGPNAADILTVLVEVLAYAGDELSYFQDAVGTEAYLDTARLRASVRRHARLVDYELHEGCNARTWMCFQVKGTVPLPQGTQLVTRIPGLDSPTVSAAAAQKAANNGAAVFETMAPAILYEDLNEITLVPRSESEADVIAAGATSALVSESFSHLQNGAVLVLEQVLDPSTGLPLNAGDARAHAIRITEISAEGANVRLSWDEDDALPFAFWINTVVDDALIPRCATLWGNAVLADAGCTYSAQTFPAIDPLRHLTFAEKTPSPEQPASAALVQHPSLATAQVSLTDSDGNPWTAVRDLLSSGPFARVFVVEIDTDGTATVRFGDGALGRAPMEGLGFTGTYRIGNGAAGNVPAGSVSHAAISANIQSVRNPMPGQGGTDPEPVEHARLYAPEGYRIALRGVTPAALASIAERHPAVRKAAASLQWSGDLPVYSVAVDPMHGEYPNRPFLRTIRRYLDAFRIAGIDVSVVPPDFVPLDICLAAYVKPGYRASEVRAALAEKFGPRGYFKPDRFTFGEPVYLSDIVSTALAVAGVDWINSDSRTDPRIRFQRWGKTPAGELEAGVITIGSIEIARAQTDPRASQNGRIEFLVLT